LQAKNLYVVAQLEALRTKKIAPTQKPVLEVEESPTSASSEDEAGSGTGTPKHSGMRADLDKLKAKWRQVRRKDPKSSSSKPGSTMSLALASLIVYTVGVKCHGLEVEYAPEHIFSLSENTVNKLIKGGSMSDLIKHNQTHVVRIYPKGMRVNSTNYEPHRYWAAGAQVVAINWQTFGWSNFRRLFIWGNVC
jgi:phosphatidylinositol phospholipase C delta